MAVEELGDSEEEEVEEGIVTEREILLDELGAR